MVIVHVRADQQNFHLNKVASHKTFIVTHNDSLEHKHSRKPEVV
jgi:hypothetical protein